MDVAASLGRAVRTLVFLAVVGFVALALIGPVVALVSVVVSLALSLVAVLLPFAVVGLLVWAPYQMVSRDPRTAWANIRHQVAAFAGRMRDILSRALTMARWVVRQGLSRLGVVRPVARKVTAAAADVSIKACAAAREYGPVAAEACARGVKRAAREGEAAVGAVLHEGRNVCVRTWPWARFLGGLLLETAGGAAVGALLVGVANLGHQGLEERLAAGAAAGALVGLIVAAARGRPKREAGC